MEFQSVVVCTVDVVDEYSFKYLFDTPGVFETSFPFRPEKIYSKCFLWYLLILLKLHRHNSKLCNKDLVIIRIKATLMVR